MSRVCDICGRGPSVGIKKSHSNIKTRRVVLLNLQTKRMNGKKTKICTACLKNRGKISKNK